MKTRRAYIHVFLMLALVLAGVSPACKFISGKSIMEICGADGSVKAAEMPDDLAVFIASSDAPTSDRTSDHADPGDDCAFCFTVSTFKPVLAQAVYVPLMPRLYRSLIIAFLPSHVGEQKSAHQPRGPPAFS